MTTLTPIPPIRRGAYGTFAYGTLSWSGSRAAEVVVLFPVTKTITLPPQVREIELPAAVREITLPAARREVELPPHPNQPKE